MNLISRHHFRGSEFMVFKEKKDLQLWRRGHIPEPLRSQLALMNAYATVHFRRPIRVTAIQKPGPFHQTMEAADVSRRSNGEKAFFGDDAWTEENAVEFEFWCLTQGIPLTVIYRGAPAEHWHVGPVATLIYQNE